MTGVRRALALRATAIAAALGFLTFLAPSAQLPASAAADCRVTSASLSWGFKASFRAYLTSSIANGSWSTSGNAGYSTPNFSWTLGTGSFGSATTSGQLAFTGAVRFTGHEGLLDSTFSNLRVRFTDASSATLVVDYTGVSMADALSGSATPKTYADVDFVTLALGSGTRGGSGTTTTFTSVPTRITAAGFAAFGSYETGTAMDPMTISITTDACGAPSPTKPSTPGTQGGTTPSGTTPSGATTPEIVGATGLQLPAKPADSSSATPRPDPSGAPAGSSAADATSTRTLGILASADSPGASSGDALLFGLAGLAVGIAATLLIQFAHLQLLAKRKATREE